MRIDKTVKTPVDQKTMNKARKEVVNICVHCPFNECVEDKYIGVESRLPSRCTYYNNKFNDIKKKYNISKLRMDDYVTEEELDNEK